MSKCEDEKRVVALYERVLNRMKQWATLQYVSFCQCLSANDIVLC